MGDHHATSRIVGHHAASRIVGHHAASRIVDTTQTTGRPTDEQKDGIKRFRREAVARREPWRKQGLSWHDVAVATCGVMGTGREKRKKTRKGAVITSAIVWTPRTSCFMNYVTDSCVLSSCRAAEDEDGSHARVELEVNMEGCVGCQWQTNSTSK